MNLITANVLCANRIFYENNRKTKRRPMLLIIIIFEFFKSTIEYLSLLKAILSKSNYGIYMFSKHCLLTHFIFKCMTFSLYFLEHFPIRRRKIVYVKRKKKVLHEKCKYMLRYSCIEIRERMLNVCLVFILIHCYCIILIFCFCHEAN